MFDSLASKVGGKKTLWVMIAGLSVLLVMLLTIVVLLLADNDDTSSRSEITDDSESNLSESSGSKFNSGTASSLSGTQTTISRPNLKGLTLRINQIDTCHPTTISAFVAVSSEEGVVNQNFSKSDVKVYFDGREIKDFKFDPVNVSQSPLANVLAIDRSGSMKGDAISNARTAAVEYASKVGAKDRLGLVQFDHEVNTLSGLTTNKDKIISLIKGITERGDTALYQAIGQSLGEAPDCGRRAVTVLADGDDNSSQVTESDVIAKANELSTPIFAVGLRGSTFNPSSISKIAESTGGQYLEATNASEISKLYSLVNAQLTGQFVTNFEIEGLKKDGKQHTIKIVSSVEGSETTSERTFIYN